MRSGTAEKRLRGADPITLDVEAGSLSAKPLTQIHPANLADLFALHALDGLPASLDVRLRGFPDRIARAVADCPPGELHELLDGLDAVDPARVPPSLRVLLAAESQRRTGADKVRLTGLVGTWEGTEPEAFEIGASRVARQLPEGPRRKEPVRGKQARAAAAERPAGAPARAPRAAPVDADPQRTAWVRQVVIERLASASSGLLEPVLLASVRHRARGRHEDLTDKDILAVLRELERRGDLRLSARRWMLGSRR